MYEWIEVVNANSSLENLSTANQNKLRDLAVDYYNTTAGKKASAVLNHYYHEDHFIPPYYGMGSASVRALQNSENQIEIHLLTAYPNPADELVQLKVCLSGQTITDESIIIIDASGRQIANLKVVNNEQQIVIDTRTFAAGNYQAILRKGEMILDNVAFNVVH